MTACWNGAWSAVLACRHDRASLAASRTGRPAGNLCNRVLPPPGTYVLPGASGYQICRQLKTAEETRESKVILVSGKDQASDRFWGMRQGADEYVTKPFTSEQLLAAVDRQL